jgi:hypothetical protein
MNKTGNDRNEMAMIEAENCRDEMAASQNRK